MTFFIPTRLTLLSTCVCLIVSQAAHSIGKTTEAAVELSPKVAKSYSNLNNNKSPSHQKFVYDAELGNTSYTYIVELNALSVAQEPTAAAQLSARKRGANRNRSSLNIANESSVLQRQLTLISKQQQQFLTHIAPVATNTIPLATYQYAINGFALKLTQNQAQLLSTSPEVKRIVRERVVKLDTDYAPALVGAPKVWDGSTFASVEMTQGEGIVIAILDSGVNTDHPSFAEVSADGYVHTNPLGDGVFLGDCAGNFTELCNNKLIGVYSYPIITQSYNDDNIFPPNLPKNGEDYGGHGSHVASIAAGNVLLNIEEVTPTLNEERSDGTPTGFTFAQISGIAPRANIISYQVCFPGTEDNNDTYNSCVDSAVLSAIDDAIRDNVDVINFSISGGGNPWSNATDLAFLSARNAGIFVAVSAGNSGPLASTSEKHAPWYTSVAASEHGRKNVFAKQLNNFNGGASTLTQISGQSNSGEIRASIVYAGNYTNTNDLGADAGQCLQPFPTNTFQGQIVVCDRGDVARVEKAQNVASAGAGGFVLANIDGGTTFLANDQYVVPGIHIDAQDGNRLKTWLATGTNHMATITVGVSEQFIDASRQDVITDFSARGPNTSISTLAPTMTAPGFEIYAAYADEQLGHDGHEPAASDYDYLNGTSMSSPMVAGAAALISSARPNWGPDEIRSALALTATTAMKKEDATSAADFFDMGSGRIQIDQAIASGLIMSESGSNYTNADPFFNGEPRNLNLPSITDNKCEITCTWSRKFTATTDATWSFLSQVISTGMTVNAVPSSFTLREGQSQTVVFTIDTTGAVKEFYSFALAIFSSPGLPNASLPISVIGSAGNTPREVYIEGQRAIDSTLIKNIRMVELENFVLTPYKPVKATTVSVNLKQDSDVSSYLDNVVDGVNITTIVVPDDAKRLVAKTTSTAKDVDLFVLKDQDGDGIPSITEEIAISANSGSNELITINYPEPGTYFIAIQNFESSEKVIDSVEMRYAIVTDQLAGNSLQTQAPSATSANEPFDIRVIYNLPNAQAGDEYFSVIEMGTRVLGKNLGIIKVNIKRIEDDVSIDATPTRVIAGDTFPFSISIDSNPSNEARNYRIVLPLPVGTQFGDFTTSHDGQLINNEIIWFVNKDAGADTSTILNVNATVLSGVQPGPIDLIVKSELIGQSFSELESAQVYRNIQVEGSPTLNINGSKNASLSVAESKTLTLPLAITEPNNDDISVSWRQNSGPSTEILKNNGSYTLAAPSVEVDTLLSYTLTVTDSNGNMDTAELSVTVNTIATSPSGSGGGGSLPIWILLLVPIAILRRKY